MPAGRALAPSPDEIDPPGRLDGTITGSGQAGGEQNEADPEGLAQADHPVDHGLAPVHGVAPVEIRRRHEARPVAGGEAPDLVSHDVERDDGEGLV